MKQTELAWAAGFFDGEGCTSICHKHQGKGILQVSVMQRDRYVLDRFKAAVEFGNVWWPKPGMSTKHGAYKVTGKKALIVLQRLWPYLSPVKKDQALLKISECNREEYVLCIPLAVDLVTQV